MNGGGIRILTHDMNTPSAPLSPLLPHFLLQHPTNSLSLGFYFHHIACCTIASTALFLWFVRYTHTHTHSFSLSLSLCFSLLNPTL
ncbi:unnamed protein product [Prunus armeniaca]